MISLICIYSLIFIHAITNVHSKEPPGDVVGSSACECFGSNQYVCKTPDVPVDNLPKECTSYFYKYITMAETDTTMDAGAEFNTEKDYLNKLVKTNVNVLVYFFHDTQKDWCASVNCNNSAGQTKEMNVLKKFFGVHPGVKGIIITGLLDLSADVTSKDCPDYTQNLKAYIDLMRKTFSEMSIGIAITSVTTKKMYNNPKLAWLDYKVLDPSVDFYIINFEDLNVCTDEFTKTGIYPLSGKNDNTVDAMKKFLDDAGVPSSKSHYTFFNFGVPKDKNRSCDAFSTAYCKNVKEAKTSICADTIQTLFEKGEFAKKNGAGFVTGTIDSDDIDCTCNCGQSYPGFHALLNGYNGAPPPQPCALFDRT